MKRRSVKEPLGVTFQHPACFKYLHVLDYSSTVMMDVKKSSETSAKYQNLTRHIFYLNNATRYMQNITKTSSCKLTHLNGILHADFCL
jgi:ABC-type transporter Mla maintaining outer membrane lipid asymmetry ATPase subunit MlaF